MEEHKPVQEVYYPPTVNSNTEKADLLERIRPDEIVDIIRQRLLGKEFKDGKWELNPSDQKRKLSERGAWEISNLMLPASSQNVSISNLKDSEITKRTLSMIRTAMLMALRNWKEYGITGADQIYFIKEIIQTNTFVTLKQPESEGIRKLIKGTTSEVRSVSDSGEPRRGFLGRFISKK